MSREILYMIYKHIYARYICIIKSNTIAKKEKRESNFQIHKLRPRKEVDRRSRREIINQYFKLFPNLETAATENRAEARRQP